MCGVVIIFNKFYIVETCSAEKLHTGGANIGKCVKQVYCTDCLVLPSKRSVKTDKRQRVPFVRSNRVRSFLAVDELCQGTSGQVALVRRMTLCGFVAYYGCCSYLTENTHRYC
jgi:hypothetical protein